MQTRWDSVVVKSLYCEDWIVGGLPPDFAAQTKRVLESALATAVSVTICAISRRTFGSSLSGSSSRFAVLHPVDEHFGLRLRDRREREHREALEIERLRDHLEALAALADEVVVRDEYVLEEDLVGGVLADRRQALDLEARVIHRDQEEAEAVVLRLVRVGARADPVPVAKCAEVVHIFWPLSFQPPSTFSALSCMFAASEPAWGSL